MPFQASINNLPCAYYCLHMGAWKLLSLQGSDHTVQPACAPSPCPWHRIGTLSSKSPESTSYEGLASLRSQAHLACKALASGWWWAAGNKTRGCTNQSTILEHQIHPERSLSPGPGLRALPPGGQMPAWKAGLTMQACLSLVSVTGYTNWRFGATLLQASLLTPPVTFAHCMSLCHILVILAVFQTFCLTS